MRGWRQTAVSPAAPKAERHMLEDMGDGGDFVVKGRDAAGTSERGQVSGVSRAGKNWVLQQERLQWNQEHQQKRRLWQG